MEQFKRDFKKNFLLFLKKTYERDKGRIIETFKEVGFEESFLEETIKELLKEYKIKIERTALGVENIDLVVKRRYYPFKESK